MARDDDDDTAVATAPRSDVFVGMLAIAMLALLIAATLLYVDHEALTTGTPAPSDPRVQLSEAGLNKLAAPGTATTAANQ